jgi:hypothetical protein
MAGATSWTAIFTNDGAGNWTPTVFRNGSLSGGTAITLSTDDAASFTYLPAVLMRAGRALFNALSTGTFDNNTTCAFAITVDANQAFTATAKYGGVTNSGGTSITLPTADAAAFNYFKAIFSRARRAIENDYSTNG